MEQLLIGILAVVINMAAVFITIARVQIRNREDITRLETEIEHLKKHVYDE